mmetsp:Transcript_9665/g.34306  ORF Transcript_9665/g.34306 Transcript_9665/m.34306 type:complete len:100 (+) Transcript_9665:83-382(+)
MRAEWKGGAGVQMCGGVRRPWMERYTWMEGYDPRARHAIGAGRIPTCQPCKTLLPFTKVNKTSATSLLDGKFECRHQHPHSCHVPEASRNLLPEANPLK